MSSKKITKTLIVDPMTCTNCENIIEQSLTKEDGIIKVSASYSSGTVSVTFDESRINLAKIIEIIEKAGYHAKTSAVSLNGNPAPEKNGGNKAGSDLPDKGGDYTGIIGAAIIIFAIYMIVRRFGLFNLFYKFPIVKNGMGYGMLFLIGTLTSVHCTAMCGGICLSQCISKKPEAELGKYSALRPSLLYNLGRIISYTVIGGIIGAAGSVISFSGTGKGILQISAGIFMVIMGINMLNLFPGLRRFQPRMPKVFARKIYASRNRSPIYVGLLNGLMPCGPLQAMQLFALSSGSPVKGALSMLLFGLGTVPLMFTFGAVSSFLSKKFTRSVMSIGAVLVVIMGIFMLNSGLGLSGILLPGIASATASGQKANVARIENGVQTVASRISSGQYEPIIVQKGIPVKWTLQAEAGDINGCNSSIIIQKYGIQKTLQQGNNMVEFTPAESGTIPFSCWMGMIRSKIIVVDDINKIDSSLLKAAGSAAGTGAYSGIGASCCQGGSGTNSGAGASCCIGSNYSGGN